MQPCALPTLVHVLDARASIQPERRLFTFLRDGEQDEQSLSWEALARRCASVAAVLAEHTGPKEPVLLLLPTGPDFAVAMLGCLRAGRAAVPAALPANPRDIVRLVDIARDAGVRVVLSTSEVVPLAAGFVETVPELKAARWLAVDTLPDASYTGALPCREDVAFLQYTSGSTGDPKGVVITHGNLMANEELIRQAFAHGPDSVGVGWLPLFHDMGLIGNLLQPIYAGFPCTLLSPEHFLRRPRRWLEAISRFGATTSGGPDFAYALCVRKVPAHELEGLELRTWRVAFSGAEPVRPATLQRFAAHFAPAGFRASSFYPCYGLAEATLFVTGGSAGGGAEEVDGRISCGRAWGEHAVAVVEPGTHERRPEGVAGEVWVRGPSVAAEYWNRPGESEATFGALVPGEPHRWLRTGDEGVLRGGRLIITGRLKDLLVIRGRNHHPHDLEATLERLIPHLRPGCVAVFSLERGGEEHAAVAAETQGGEPLHLVSEIRRALSEHHGLRPAAVALLGPRSLPKTTSGKVRRSATREAFLARALEELFRWEEPPDEPELREMVATQLGVPVGEIDPTAPLTGLGVDSVQALQLAEALERRTGRRITPAFLFAHPSLRQMAGALRGEEAEPRKTADPEAVTPPEAAAAPLVSEDVWPEDVAVLGLSGRFPGAASVEALWELLCEGRVALAPRPGRSGEVGGFLSDLDRFDPLFFHLSPAEARLLDPQQRLFLEVGWEALEDAGLAGPAIRGSLAGVFVGVSQVGFREHLGPARSEFDAVLGTGLAAAANRFSYTFDLRGPSLVVDTLCSSSLTALHLACRALQAGDCELAVVGGVNTLLDPHYRAAMASGGVLSPTGRSRPFLEEADGFVPSEGAVAVVLKRLGDALRDGDRVLGVIRATAVNHNGRSNGMAAPNPAAQSALVARTWARSGRSPADAALLEAHGTGTALGDPMEVQALGEVFRGSTGRPGTCALGALKGNLGHLEAASGLAGLAKVLLALERGQIPPNAPEGAPNPLLSLEDTPFYLPDRIRPWTGARLAGVSSFGMGGANAHVVVEGSPRGAITRPQESEPAHLLVLSAHTETALRNLVEAWLSWLDRAGEVDLRDVCYTAATGRTPQRLRAAVVARDREQLRDRLALLRWAPLDLDMRPSGVIRGRAERATREASRSAAQALAAARAAREPRDLEAALRQLAEAWVTGAEVDLGALHAGRVRRRVALPLTPFDRIRCWPGEPEGMATPAREERLAGAAPPPPVPSSSPGLVPNPAEMEALLSGFVSRELEIPPERLSPTQPFAELGVDSVRAIHLLSRFGETTGVHLPATLFFDWPDLRALARGLLSHHPDAAAAAWAAWRTTSTKTTAAPTPPTRPLDEASAAPPSLAIAPLASPQAREPIAIIGMSGRFPDAPTLDAFWRNLRAGHDAVREVPKERWDPARLYRPHEDTPGTSVSKWGGFLDGLDQFDPLFFRLSPREAEQMDPQQRLMLEVAWEALEQAGYAGGQLGGTRTGVFVGATYSHYSREHIPYFETDAYGSIGNSIALLSNRLSYFFDLQGPSLTVDTLCSSSLVALHLAVGALRRGECDAALVGGVHAGMGFGYYQGLSRLHAVSKKGACHTFSAEADGYIPGEGAGAVLLKPLSRALADGDFIWGVVLGSAVNHGGKASGLTVPRASAQTWLIRLALQDAGISADSLGYLEAHGTGTPLGDPIEVQGLTAAFREDTQRRQFCGIGAVKSNLGHLEPAAGMAALVKALLMMHHRTLPPTLHVERLNSILTFEDSPFFVCDRPRPWEAQEGPRRAGISGFGMGGANAHVVLEEAPPLPTGRAAAPRSAHALCLSARSEQALELFAAEVHEGLDAGLAPADVCWTASSGKAQFPHRLVVVGPDLDALRTGLEAAARGRTTPALITGTARTHGRPRVAWLLPGAGAAWPGMGVDLMSARGEVREAVERCAGAFEVATGTALHALLADPAHAAWSDPGARAGALVAVELGLAALLERWLGLPGAALGEGVGVLAARVLAGALPVNEAIRSAVAMGRGAPLPVLPTSPRLQVALPGETGHDIGALVRQGYGFLVEVGPDAVSGPPPGEALLLHSGLRGSDGWPELLATAAALWVRGVPVDWASVDGPHARRKVRLPTVPFERQRYWRDRMPIPGERDPAVPTPTPARASEALDGPSRRRRASPEDPAPSMARAGMPGSAALDRRGTRRPLSTSPKAGDRLS